MKIAEVLELILDSNNFTVGGGSSSALAGAMAAGLAGMVARLSLKKPVGLTVADYEKLITEADELARKLEQGAIKDTKAYLLIKDAYGLPKGTDDEKKVRGQAISDAGIAAASVPRDNALMCKRAHGIATVLLNQSNPAASSDLASAVYLSMSGVKGCLLNIEANLPLIKEDTMVQSFEEFLSLLKKYSEENSNV